jgi:DNA integrity scanning protein DisA with diadenylate cyclase activity
MLYLIIGEEIDKDGRTEKFCVMELTKKNIGDAMELLEKIVKNYIKEKAGNEASQNMKIIDIKSLDQVNEPSIDSFLVYRLESNPQVVYIYQRKTQMINGWWQKVVSEFRLIKKISIVTYDDKADNEDMKMVMVNNVKIPEFFVNMPMKGLIEELKESPIFLRMASLNNLTN